MLSTLKEKQAYYQYDERPLRMKAVPDLNRDLVQAMKREHLNRAYRLVWGGAVIVREEPNSIAYTIARGGPESLETVQVTMPAYEKVGALVGSSQLVAPEVRAIVMPKYIHERARQARGYYYHDATGTKICTTREELIPKEYLTRIDYRYVDFGRLYWHLEMRTNADTLIDAQLYDKRDKVPEGAWECVMVLKAKNGLYYEPGLEMIEVLQQRESENRNENLKDVARRRILRQWKSRLEQEAADEQKADTEFDLFYNDLEREVRKGKRFAFPNFIPPKQKLPFQQ